MDYIFGLCPNKRDAVRDGSKMGYEEEQGQDV